MRRETQNPRHDEDHHFFLSLACGQCALRVREVLSSYLLERWLCGENGVLPPICPEGFRDSQQSLLDGDIATMGKCWGAMSGGGHKAEKARWRNAALDVEPRAFKYVKLPKFKNPSMRYVLKRVARYQTMYENTSRFSEAWQKWSAQGFPRYGSPFEEVNLRWAQQFTVLVSPVTRERRQCVHCVEPHLHGALGTSWMNCGPAYRAFFEFMKEAFDEGDDEESDDGVLRNGWKGERRQGLRSQNNMYFNDLAMTKPSSDFPAGMLAGTRSGLQFQIRSMLDDGKIVGVVAMYFPTYNFWHSFGVIEPFGYLVNPRIDGDLHDESYLRFWRYGPPDEMGSADRFFLEMINSLRQQNLLSAISARLEAVAESWNRLDAAVIRHSVPKEVVDEIDDLYDPDKSDMCSEPSKTCAWFDTKIGVKREDTDVLNGGCGGPGIGGGRENERSRIVFAQWEQQVMRLVDDDAFVRWHDNHGAAKKVVLGLLKLGSWLIPRWTTPNNGAVRSGIERKEASVRPEAGGRYDGLVRVVCGYVKGEIRFSQQGEIQQAYLGVNGVPRYPVNVGEIIGRRFGKDVDQKYSELIQLVE